MAGGGGLGASDPAVEPGQRQSNPVRRHPSHVGAWSSHSTWEPLDRHELVRGQNIPLTRRARHVKQPMLKARQYGPFKNSPLLLLTLDSSRPYGRAADTGSKLFGGLVIRLD